MRAVVSKRTYPGSSGGTLAQRLRDREAGAPRSPHSRIVPTSRRSDAVTDMYDPSRTSAADN
jgi:hypothetical protein